MWRLCHLGSRMELLGTRCCLRVLSVPCGAADGAGGTCRGRVGLCCDLWCPHKGAALCWLQNETCHKGLAGSRWKGLCGAEWLSPGAPGQVFGSLGKMTGAAHMSPVAIHLSCLRWLAGTGDFPAGFPPPITAVCAAALPRSFAISNQINCPF